MPYKLIMFLMSRIIRVNRIVTEYKKERKEHSI